MPDTIKQISIAGTTGNDTRDIGAEAQYIEVSYDSEGKIIKDITVPGVVVDHTGPLTEALGQVNPGVGLEINSSTGLLDVKYGNAEGTAAQGNDSRLSNDRKNPQAVTFSNGTTTETYDGSVAKTVTYATVGAAPKDHASATSEYGIATANNYGHVKLGSGVTHTSGVIRVNVDGTSVVLNQDGTVSAMGEGSTVVATTPNRSLYGKTVFLSQDGSQIATTTFDNTGVATFNNVPCIGTVTLSTTDGVQTATETLNMPYFGKYSVVLEIWEATITITTDSSEFYGSNITVEKDGTQIDTITFSNSGEATYLTTDTGLYTFTVTYSGLSYSSSVNVITESKTYQTQLNLWMATVEITTDSTELYGSTISVEKSGEVVGTTIFDSSGEATFIVGETGTYTFTVTYRDLDFSDTVNVTEETTYSASIHLWKATINVTTNSPELYSASVTVTKGGTLIDTITLDSSGAATFDAIETGSYVFSTTYDGVEATVTTAVSAETTYTALLHLWTATIYITANLSDLYGRPITITKDAVLLDTINFDETGSANYTVHVNGSYLLATSTTGGAEYSTTVNITAEQVYAASLGTITKTITIYSAVNDTVTYTDSTGTRTATTGSGGSGTATITFVPPSQSISFKSAISGYTRANTITTSSTSAMVRPDNCAYWYGYNSGAFAGLITAGYSKGGWTYQNAAFQTNQINCNLGSVELIEKGVGAYSAIAGNTTINVIAGGCQSMYWFANSSKSGGTMYGYGSIKNGANQFRRSQTAYYRIIASGGEQGHPTTANGIIYAIYY